jgi:hypothetical protein
MPNSHQLAPKTLIESIPEPDTVRHWLADAIREAALLRSLLRVAERKANLQRWSASCKESQVVIESQRGT